MRRSAFFWLVATVVFWGWMIASNSHQATSAFKFSAILGGAVLIGLLGFHVIRAKLGR